MLGARHETAAQTPRELDVYEDRFRNATNTDEKLQALQDLNNLGQAHPAAVGERMLPLILDALQHDLSEEEMCEILELVHTLVHTPDLDAAEQNTALIVQEQGTITSLLDLLASDNFSAIATALQILGRVHECARAGLEAEIQNSPESVTRMLQALQEREEIRMEVLQLLVAITQTNQEMKKSVAFNEGFETLFSIMKLEGWADEPTSNVRECLVVCRNILEDCPTAQRLFVDGSEAYSDMLCDFFDIEHLSLANLDPEQDGVDYLTPFRVDDTLARLAGDQLRTECMIAAMNVLRVVIGERPLEPPPSSSSLPEPPRSQDKEGMERRRKALLSSHRVLPSTLSVIAVCRGLPASAVEAALDLLIVLCDGAAESQLLLMNTIVRTVRTTNESDNDPAGLTFQWIVSGVDTTQWIPLPSLLGDRYTYCFDAVELLEDDEDSLGHSTVATLTRKCFSCLETLLKLDEMGSFLVLQSMVAPAPIDSELATYDGAFINPMELDEPLLPLGKVVLDALNANMHELTNPECVDPMVFANPASRLANMLTCVILNGGSMAKALAGRVPWEVAIDGGESGMVSGMARWAGFSARTALESQDAVDDAFQQAHWLTTGALVTNIACTSDSSVALCGLAFADSKGAFLFELLSENATVPLNIQALACLAIGTSIVTLSDAKLEEGNPLAELCGSQLKDIESQVGVAAFLDILTSAANKLKQKRANKKLLSEEWERFFFCASFENFFEQQIPLIQKTLVEKLSLVSPMYDQGDQHETIQRLQARIQELEAALSSGGSVTTGSASDTELDALKKQISDQEGEILKLKELINAERNNSRTQAEELTQKAKTLEMMQQEMDKMVSPLEYDRLKLESEKQIQLLQSRLEQQKQAVGNGGPQSDAMLAKIAECERLVEENTEKNVYISQLQETIDRLQRHADTGVHDQLKDALYALKHIDPAYQNTSADFDDENVDPDALAADISTIAGQVADDVRLYRQQLDDVAAALGQSLKALVEAAPELHKVYKDVIRGDEHDEEDVTIRAELTRELVRHAAGLLAASQEELDHARADYDQQRQEMDSAYNEVVTQLQGLKDQVTGLMEERDELVRKLDEQEEHLQQREELISQMAEDISEKDRRWEQRGSGDSELSAQLDRLKQVNDELTSENEQFEAKIEELTAANAHLTESVNALQGQMRKVRVDKDQHFKDLQDKEAELQRLRAENTKLQGALQPLSESHSSLKNELSSVQREMTNEMQTLQQQLQQRDDRINDLEQQVQELEANLARAEAAGVGAAGSGGAGAAASAEAECANCARLEAEIQSLQGDIDTLTSELMVGGGSSSAQTKQLQQQVQQLLDEVDELHNRNEELKDELAAARAQGGQTPAASGVDDDQLQQLQEDHDHLQEEHEHLRDEYEQLLADYQSLQAKHKELLANSEQLSKDVARASQQAVELDETARRLQDTTEKYNTLKAESQQQVQKMREEIASIHSENTRLQNENKHLLSHIQNERSAEQKELTEALEAARKELDQMTHRNAATQSDYAQLQEAYAELQAKVREWGTNADQRTSAQVQSLEADNAALQAKLSAMSAELVTVKAQLEAMSHQLDAERESLTNLQETWEQVNDENTELRMQFSEQRDFANTAVLAMCRAVKDVGHAMAACIESMQRHAEPSGHGTSNGAAPGPRSPKQGRTTQNLASAFSSLSTEIEAVLKSQQQLEQLAANKEAVPRASTELQQLLKRTSEIVHGFTALVTDALVAERAAAAAAAAASQETKASTITPKKEAAPMPAQLGKSPSLRQIREETRTLRQKYNKLQEEHDDLLGMLAQQELVLQTFRDRIRAECGEEVLVATIAEAKHNVEVEYGLYIDYGEPFSHANEHDDLDASADYGSLGGLALHDSPRGQRRSPLEMKLFPDEPPL